MQIDKGSGKWRDSLLFLEDVTWKDGSDVGAGFQTEPVRKRREPCAQAYDEKNEKALTVPLFLHLSIGFITIIKCLTSALPKLPHYTNSYGTCHFSQDEKSLYSETEVAPNTVLKAGCWQHDAVWHLSLGWKRPYSFFQDLMRQQAVELYAPGKKF